ncbi:MAG TPA: hypothetical protein VH279_08450 [Solirubrobacteraceae bacterium]|nr:hypothetical protein [Solirubrobacteraceae bacterium]
MSRTRRIALLAAAVAALATTAAGADSFTPVRLGITIAPVARLHQPLKVSVDVSADPSVLDNATGPLRIRVKLAQECGGTFSSTPGVTLLDQQLRPQPATGRPYDANTSGSGRPTRYGDQTVCAFLEEAGDNRMFANDTSNEVNVSRKCTSAAATYDAARRRHARRSTLSADRRAARRACGPGVPL